MLYAKAMALAPQFLDELRARSSLSGLVRRTVKLQRAGNEWKACCPFHDEKTPSFYVNDAKQFYHCFGCGAHGDAIRWLTDQRGLAFIDAVKELAGEAGMELPAPDPALARRAEERAGLHDALAAAQDWFAANLAGSGGASARDYLKRRGLDAHTITRFGFGWAPDERCALRAALDRFGEAMLVEAGLLIAPEANERGAAKEPYNRFRGRIMLPISDPRGRVIAFGGRILAADSTAPKYLNSPDTPVFDKGRTLYNLHRAGPAARKGGRLIVVEGYMDVIALAAVGIEEVVAPMGTALTEEQLALAWRLADKPILCFDGDSAGQRAAMRATGRALPLLEPGRSLDLALLPAGLDPDDLIRQQGKEALERVFEDAATLVETIWRHESAALPLASPEDKAGLKARLLAHVDAIAERDIRALYRRDLLDRFSAFAFPPREARASTFHAHRPAAPRLQPERTAELRRTAQGGARDNFAQAVLAGLARHPGEIARNAEALLQLAAADPHLAPAIERLVEQAEPLEGANLRPISAAVGEAPYGELRYSFLDPGHDPAEAGADLAEAVTLLVERPALEAAIAAATARFTIDPEAAFAEQQRLRTTKLAMEARIGQLARRKVNPVQTGYDTADRTYRSQETT